MFERISRVSGRLAGGMIAAAVVLLATGTALVLRHPRPTPAAAPLDSATALTIDSVAPVSPGQMDSADAVLQRSVVSRLIPGASLALGVRGHTVQTTAYGRVGWTTRDAAVSADSTMYDLASLTKAIATTSAVFLLVQDGKIRLDDPVQRSLPEFEGVGKDKVTWRHLLEHTSGLPPAGHMTGTTLPEQLRSLLRTRLNDTPGAHVQYSDLSFIVLWMAAERVVGEPLQTFLQRRLWEPLGMHSTRFWPGMTCTNCAPTLVLQSGVPYRGKPSDPIAHKLGVPTGNAGLFSTAHDLGRFAAMIANGGELDGVHVFDSSLVRQLFIQAPGAGHRTLGWEAFCPAEHLTPSQPCQVPIAYGHTGWTGTSLWIDPTRGVWVVILSNRSYQVRLPPSLEVLRWGVFLGATGGGVMDSAVVKRLRAIPANPPARGKGR